MSVVHERNRYRDALTDIERIATTHLAIQAQRTGSDEDRSEYERHEGVFWREVQALCAKALASDAPGDSWVQTAKAIVSDDPNALDERLAELNADLFGSEDSQSND